MRVLSIRQPWAWAIAAGIKPVENRTRNLAGTYRGPIAIHASKSTLDHTGLATIYELTPVRSVPIIHGHIIGVTELVDVHHADTCEHALGWCTPWSDPESHHLVLEQPQLLRQPIPYRGGLGLRRLDDTTTTAVLGALP